MNDFNQTEKNPHFFYDKNEFPFLKPLENHLPEIKEEFLALEKTKEDKNWLITFPGYVESEKEEAWKVFSFNLFGLKFPCNAQLCPKTAELLFSIPEIISSNYSYMKPHTHILPHQGYSRMQLRCHLPLIVPDEKLCGIRVGNETKYWKEGELLIFDDSFEHEAWNKTDKPRAVLMVDIPNPLWGYTAQEISKYKIENLEDPFLLGLASKEKWLESLKTGISPI
ncbi:MAG TPA: aspartyl/asparaginyl beta-hydroxylase domain-containing protein [Bacteroidia bacterium]|jgi:aspartyl/asparaginyl beta-hydroxylase (cupin superfamily)|nr:aspartyl/asparaginyl beta-hydroxylase domain-containing protein [Bacteroidia bacterium]